MRTNKLRQEILDTASRLFYKQGYHNTGINQIIEEAGIAKSSLYQNFRSKEDLLLAYLQDAGTKVDEAIAQSVAKYKTPTEKVLAVFEFLEKLIKGKNYYGCNFLNIISEMPPDAKRVRKQIKKQKDGTRKVFNDILKPVRKEHLADEMYLLFEAVLIANKVHDDGWPLKTARQMVKKLIS